MNHNGRFARLTFLAIFCFIIAAVSAFYCLKNLDSADKVASVVSAGISVATLAVTVWSTFRANDERGKTKQTLLNSEIGKDLNQISSVEAGAHVGEALNPDTRKPKTQKSSSPRSSLNDQSISGSKIGGNVNQISDVGGDVDVNQKLD